MPDTPTKPIPPGALATLQKFVDAGMRSDEATMKSCLTRQTIESGQFNGEQPKGVRFTFGDAAWDGDSVVIPMTGAADDPAAAGMPPLQMACVMVQEEDAWKFDLVATMERMLGGSMQAAMEQVAGVMNEAMEGIGNAMTEALGGSMGEEEEAAPDWSGASMTPSPDELLPQPELEPLPKLSAGLSEALGFPVAASCAMKELLRQVGSDDRSTLLNWFEDSLFAAWPQLFAEAAQVVPLNGRLRGVRIEAAKWKDDRFLAIDGNDLVYRIFLNTNEGYFSDADVQTRLAGVLAALPKEIVGSTAGKRLLPTDEESPALEGYRALVAPRWMRRISDLLGHAVRLEMNWEGIDDQARAARQFPRWLLNRVYGALVLACADEATRAELSQNLKTVRVDVVISPQYKYAKYENGVFTLGIWFWEGERGCFYEYELVPALQGNKLGEEWSDRPAADQPGQEPQGNNASPSEAPSSAKQSTKKPSGSKKHARRQRT